MKRLTVLGLFAFHVFLLGSCFMAGAQEFKADTLSLQVYFRRGESAVDAGYRDTDTLYVKETIRETIIDTVYVETQVPIYSNARGRKDYNLDGKKMLMALRTNLIAVPLANIGMEIPLGERWSVGADWYYPWLWRRNHGEGLDYQGVCFELLAGDAEIRYWFPRKGKKKQQRLLGHSIGVYGAGGYYDFERDWSGHQGWFWNAGIDYLCAVPLFQGRMHLELELGVGYIYSPSQPYDTFVAGEKAYRRAGVTQFTRWFGPTRAQISLVVPIYVKKKEVAND